MVKDSTSLTNGKSRKNVLSSSLSRSRVQRIADSAKGLKLSNEFSVDA